MRKLILTATAVAAAICLMGCSKTPAAELVPETNVTDEAELSDSGILTDKRDGQKYRTAEILGKRWMAMNLNYRTDSSWCYKNADSNCAKYGRLYNWTAAMNACPAVPPTSTAESARTVTGGRPAPVTAGP